VGRDAAPLSSFLYGQSLFEAGNYRGAAAVFDSMSRVRIPDQDPSATARNQAWTLTHRATALDALGDTAALPVLADSIQRLGQLSGLGRDRRLHLYVRGLIARARGRHEEAASAFRASMLSASLGFTRVNYALAGELIALGRPLEAVPVLRSADRSIYEGTALYLTHTEVQERLARAYEAAGMRDSAAVYYQRVVKAWENAEPEFTPRQLEARGKAMRMLERL
jgi:tetratricopeptide (TPR) repeat protein